MKKEKLTKFSDIMYYYKWHMIIAVIMIIVVAYFAVECHNKVEDDITVTAILSNYALSTAAEDVENDMVSNGLIPDLNGDGTNKMFVHIITFPIKPQNQEEMMAGQQVSVAFAADDSVLFLIDEDLLEMYEDDEIFNDISRVAELQGASEADLYLAEDGTSMGISLTDNEYLESKGIPTKTLYACYRYALHSDNSDEYQAKVDVADKILAHIMK